MIIKIKLGDLTARQVVKICEAAGQCAKCPIKTVPSDALCPYHDVDIEKYLDNEVEVSTDVLNPEMPVSFEDELQKTRQWMKNAEFESVRLQNTFWHLCHILGYREGVFNPKALWWNIVKAVNPVKPDEPYEAMPTECESFVSKETVELAKRAPYESWKNYEKSIRHLAKIAEEAEK